MSRRSSAELVKTDSHGAFKLPALHVLSEIATSLATENVLDSMLERYLTTMIRLAGAEAGAVRVLSSDGSHLRLVASVGLPKEVEERERMVDFGCGICGEAATSRCVAETSDLAVCQDRISSDYFGARVGRIVSVPMSHGERVLGVYNLFMPAGRTVPKELSRLFLSISEHLGQALENARTTREHLRAALTAERQMLSNELHDSLAQTMAYMNTRVVLMRDAVRHGDLPKIEKHLGELSQGLDSAYTELRELLGQLRNRMDPRGLLVALREAADTFYERTGIELAFANRAGDLTLSPEQEVQVFHVVQEALNNASKHSRASLVTLSIDLDGDNYRFTVEDNGVGMDCADREEDGSHYGLTIMRERAFLVGGEVSVDGRLGRGTRVTMTLPMRGGRIGS